MERDAGEHSVQHTRIDLNSVLRFEEVDEEMEKVSARSLLNEISGAEEETVSMLHQTFNLDHFSTY